MLLEGWQRVSNIRGTEIHYCLFDALVAEMIVKSNPAMKAVVLEAVFFQEPLDSAFGLKCRSRQVQYALMDARRELDVICRHVDRFSAAMADGVSVRERTGS